MGSFDLSHDECHHPLERQDAMFMAESRTLVPELAEEVLRLRKELAEEKRKNRDSYVAGYEQAESNLDRQVLRLSEYLMRWRERK